MRKRARDFRNAGDPSVAIKPAETRWLLVKNPRFGDVPSEPEYVWVEEDKVPTTFTTLDPRQERDHRAAGGRRASTARRPAAGKISPRQACRTQHGRHDGASRRGARAAKAPAAATAIGRAAARDERQGAGGPTARTASSTSTRRAS